MSEFETSNVGTKIEDPSILLPNSGGGHAVEKRDMRRKQIGDKSYWDKAFEYQFVRSFSVKSGTASGTVVANYIASDLMSEWMKGLWQLNSYTNASLEIQIVSSTNSGLTGTYVVGQCQESVATPTINTIGDTDRILRQYAMGDVFTEVLSLISNPSQDGMPMEFSSLATSFADYSKYYPRLVFINMSNVESTFANTALSSEFNLFARFTKDTKFTQVGSPITIVGGSPTDTNFSNPTKLPFDLFLPGSVKIVGDGAYGFNSTRLSLDDSGVYFHTGMLCTTVNTTEVSSGASTTVEVKTDEWESELNVEVADQYTLSANTNVASTHIGTLSGAFDTTSNPMSFTAVTEPKFVFKNIFYQNLKSDNTQVAEVLDLDSYPLSLLGLANDNTVDLAGRFTVGSAIYTGKASATHVPVNRSSIVKLPQAEVRWARDNSIPSVFVSESVSLTGAPFVASLVNHDNAPESGGEVCAAAQLSNFLISDEKIDNLLPLRTKGLVNLDESQLVQLPNDCVVIQTTQRKVVPVVPSTIVSQELPTILPEISLFDSLAKFYDPSRTFLLRVFEDKFNQLVFDFVYSGPNKCCFVKQKDLAQYFVLDVSSSGLYIGSAVDLTNTYTIPSSIISVPIVNRASASSMARLTSNARPFKGFGNLRFEGAAMSSMGSDLTSIITELMSEDSQASEGGKNRDLKVELQNLIGKQAMEQLQAQLQASLQEQQNAADLSAESNALTNPATQRAMALSSLPSSSSSGKDDSTIVNPFAPRSSAAKIAARNAQYSGPSKGVLTPNEAWNFSPDSNVVDDSESIPPITTNTQDSPPSYSKLDPNFLRVSSTDDVSPQATSSLSSQITTARPQRTVRLSPSLWMNNPPADPGSLFSF